MSIGTYFSSCDPSLSALSADVLNDIEGLLFSYRDGVESVCVVTEKLSTLASIIGVVPTEIKNASTRRYFVDLSSVGTDKLRLYIDSNDAKNVLIGYYFGSDNKMEIKKVYKRVSGDIFTIHIDRYNDQGILISSNEPELQSDRTSWLGSATWADLADNSPYYTRYLAKSNKPQSYIYVEG